jgi:predicted DNA-binding transcriptional regulator YafY
MAVLRDAIRERHKVCMRYRDAKEDASQRVIRPLCLVFFAPHWLLTAWCELRSDFRNFRLDRIQELTALDDLFKDEPGKTLDDFLRRMTAENSQTGREKQ